MASRLGAAGARGGLITVAFQGLSVVLRLSGLVLLARMIDPGVFGLIAIVTTIALFATNVISLGLPMAAAQRIGLSRRAKSSLFLVNLGLGTVVAGGMFLLAAPMADLYGHDVLEPLFRWVSLVPLLNGLQGQFQSQLIADMRFFHLSATQFASQLVGLVAAVVLAFLSLPYVAVAAQPIVQAVVLMAGGVATARWLPGRAGDWDEVRAVLRVGLHVFGMNAARNLGRSALLPLVGLSVTPAALGAFDRAQQLAIMPVTMAVDNLQRVAVPILSRMREDASQMLRSFSRAQGVIAYAVGGGFGIVAGVSLPAVDVLLGSGWHTAGVVLGILAIGSAFRALGNSVQWLFIATETTARGAAWATILQPAIVALSLAGMPWGVIGVAVANSVAWMIYWPLVTVIAARASNLRAGVLLIGSLRGVVMFALPIAVATFCAAAFVPGAPLISLIAGVAAGIVMAAILVVVPPVRRDLRSIVGMLRAAFRGGTTQRRNAAA